MGVIKDSNPWMENVRTYWSNYGSSTSDSISSKATPASESGYNSGMSQVRSAQVRDDVAGYAKSRAPMGLGSVAGNIAAGMPANTGNIVQSAIGGLVSPAGFASLGSSVAARQMGMSKPKGYVGNISNMGISAALGMVNPALGLGWGVMGPLAVDAFMDATDTREGEATRDAMEDAYGYSGGRQAYKSSMDFAHAMAPTSPVASLAMAESLVRGTQIPYSVNFARNAMGAPRARDTSWSNTAFGRLPQTMEIAAKWDAEEARAREAAEKAGYGAGGAYGGGSNSDGVGHGSVDSDGKGQGYGGKGAGADRW